MITQVLFACAKMIKTLTAIIHRPYFYLMNYSRKVVQIEEKGGSNRNINHKSKFPVRAYNFSPAQKRDELSQK